MARDPETVQTFGSTTFEWKKVKMSQRRQATQAARAERARRHALPRRDPRDKQTIVISYRGGAEAWVEIQARGTVWRYPGHVAIVDILRDICRDI
jgi:hypothetical protein